ncbi:MAG: phosphoglucosamine mutase [Candidatus Electryoneaceae bacterium]|nr:phosphoglucosamine mutase [Candidatus Electryoneaceae bacterium]
MFKGLMAGVSGIRGVVGEGMTPEVALLWSGGFGTWVKGGKVVVARDPRTSGDMLNLAVKAGLAAAGCDVDDAGMIPTPVGALAVERRGAAGGIVITASHNPQQWNALKFIRSDGRMLTANDFTDLERIVVEGPLRTVGWDRLGTVYDWDGAGMAYLGAVTGINFLDLERLNRKRLKVAIDCVNGAGSFLYPELLEALGCEVVSIHCDGSGLFPHVAEPLPENLGDLCRTVVEEQCAIGFAVDPDGDRLAIVDEKGTPIGEELTLALAVKTVLEIQSGPVVVNSLTSQVINDIADMYDVECHRTRVGEANVAAKIMEIQAVVGGEGNGGVILPQVHTVRDGGVGMAIVLNRLATRRGKVSELVDQLPKYRMIKSSYPVTGIEPHELLEEISASYEHDQVSRIDGVRVSYEDGWVQIRPSNTEPILRVYAESTNIEHARSMIEEMQNHLRRIVTQRKENE